MYSSYAYACTVHALYMYMYMYFSHSDTCTCTVYNNIFELVGNYSIQTATAMDY